MNEAIVLAGGLGTRLKGVIYDIPKPMAPIGNKPFLEYLLQWLHKKSIDRVVLAVGYKYEIIEQYFGNTYKKMELVYAVENEPLGTGGAIANAIPYCESDSFFLINGDTFFDVDLELLKATHIEHSSELTLSLKEMTSFDRYGSVELVDSHIQAFKEKTFIEKGLINGGVYYLQKAIFNRPELGKRFSFETDIMEAGVGHIKMAGLVSDSYFIDIGIPDDYAKASEELPSLFS